jgi:hypothetical protein
LERVYEREFLAIERFERKIWGDVAGDDVGHAWFGSEGMRDAAEDRHK